MGALHGSIAVRRYRVHGNLPRDLRARFVKQIRVHAHVPLDPMSDVDTSQGWVSSRDPFDADLDAEKVFFGERLVLTLRIDVLKAPRTEVKRMLSERERAFEAEKGRPLARREKRVLKEEVERELRTRIFPRTRVCDLAWDLSTHTEENPQGRLYFWSTTKGANEALVDLFVKTFGLELEPEGPARWTHDVAAAAALALQSTREKGAPKLDAGELIEQVRARLRDLQPTRELLFGFAGIRPGSPDDPE